VGGFTYGWKLKVSSLATDATNGSCMW